MNASPTNQASSKIRFIHLIIFVRKQGGTCGFTVLALSFMQISVAHRGLSFFSRSFSHSITFKHTPVSVLLVC